MNHVDLPAILRETGAADDIQQVIEATIVATLASEPTSASMPTQPERLPRLGFLYEIQGLGAYRKWTARKSASDRVSAQEAFGMASACWRGLLSLSGEEDIKELQRIVSAEGKRLMAIEMPEALISPELALALHLGVASIASGRSAEARLDLSRFALSDIPNPRDWRSHVASNVFRAFVLLVRKQDGWKDIDYALQSIAELRQLQAQFEETWLKRSDDNNSSVQAALSLVGLYHLAQLVTLCGDYLSTGKDAASRTLTRLERHQDQATTAFESVGDQTSAHLARLLHLGCRELVQNCIWAQVEGLGEPAKELAKHLARRGAERPVIELWPAQQAALRDRLLDPYPRAIAVEMPTSAGKTLLAKFAIVQTRALSHGTIAYIVPTRALVNQVTLELRADFRDLKLRVEQAVPAFEMDPTEDRLLQSDTDVLVTTPEKLDLLVRKDHAITKNLALVIADEAHSLAERHRGPRLELLLGMIKRDKPGVRFLLLSPFIPESQELLTWLGDERTIPPIRVNWRPSRRVVGALRSQKKKGAQSLILETLAAADNVDVRAGLKIILARDTHTSGQVSIRSLVREAVEALSNKGSILVLCRGPGTSVTRALELAKVLPKVPLTPECESVSHYLEAEIGRESALSKCIRHGVVYHHAGLSLEARALLEGLIRRGHVKVVCGTTTLAQGVNFPISTVIIETLQKGNDDLTYSEFWNIAGRAGRTLVDPVGLVAFPAPTMAALTKFSGFLKGEASAISSQLAVLVERIDEIGSKFDINTLFNVPELSPLLQFLAHALRVSGNGDFAAHIDEVEDILRSSLVYHQVRAQSEPAVQRLIALCRAYLEQVRGLSRGTLVLADQTGFATPSVLNLLQRKSGTPEFQKTSEWQPSRLFGEDLAPLTSRISAIASLPEIQLGSDDAGPFDARRVASILRDWVRGEPLDAIARRHARATPGIAKDPDKELSEFSKYLFSKLLGRASWGMGALESVCLAGTADAGREEAEHVPSMIYFGVSHKEAVWFRMVGVPRVVAEGLGRLWKARTGRPPQSFEDLRGWVGELSESDWRNSLPPKSPLSPTDLRWIWKEFSGA